MSHETAPVYISEILPDIVSHLKHPSQGKSGVRFKINQTLCYDAQ